MTPGLVRFLVKEAEKEGRDGGIVRPKWLGIYGLKRTKRERISCHVYVDELYVKVRMYKAFFSTMSRDI